MNAKDKILNYLKEKQSATGKELAALFGISRQAVNKQIKRLIQESKVIKEGSTRGVVYKYHHDKKRTKFIKSFSKTYLLTGLEEDKVFHELALFLCLSRELSKSALDIARYAFTEMLNNAIDHSESTKCLVEVSLEPYILKFRIRDFGIGLFYSIFKKFGLSDENAAIGELIKGKTTTMKEKHSGEGIFFTSKAADVIFFRSHKIKLVFDNQNKDVFVEEKKSIVGTEVVFNISKKSKKKLDKIFTQFAPEEFDFRFERTRVHVKLLGKNYLSRSEAKRLLYGLHKFKEIILDFDGVNAIGQSFADEIFRVFRNEHPEIVITIENLRPTLESMINHVVDNNI